MTKKTPDRPAKSLFKARAPKVRAPRDSADAPGDFYFDELMTPQPDSMREFLRSRLMKPVKPEKKGK